LQFSCFGQRRYSIADAYMLYQNPASTYISKFISKCNSRGVLCVIQTYCSKPQLQLFQKLKAC